MIIAANRAIFVGLRLYKSMESSLFDEKEAGSDDGSSLFD
jgi:hypothetical protein